MPEISSSVPVPLPADAPPPSVADASAMGDNMRYALANHTHASKVRKARVQTASDGSLSWTFSTPFGAGVVPIIAALAERAGGTDIYNVQLTSTPTNTGCQLLVNRVQQTVASLLGLTILSVPASPGVTWLHLVAVEP